MGSFSSFTNFLYTPTCLGPRCIYLFNIQYIFTAATAAKSLQSCPTLCNPRDGSPPGSPVPGILQARTLEWVAISFSSAWKWKVKEKSLSCVQPHRLQPARLLCPWNSLGENAGVGCHFLLQGIFPTQVLNPCLLHAGRFFPVWMWWVTFTDSWH